MTSEETAFIHNIIVDPSDDFPRLVYADWLEENGNSQRSEFIRIQCRLAKWPDSEYCPECGKHWAFRVGFDGKSWCSENHEWFVKDYNDLCTREIQLGTLDNCHKWAGVDFPLYGLSNWSWAWKRGFIYKVRCHINDWYNRSIALDVVRVAPIEELELVGLEPNIHSHSVVWYRTGFSYELFDLLEGEKSLAYSVVGEKHYVNRDLALKAFCKAALNLARSKVNLPILKLTSK